MSRLIDADALIEFIKESRPLNWTDSESELQEDADYNHFIEMVNAQPTAYDVEKVVTELVHDAEAIREFAGKLIDLVNEFPTVENDDGELRPMTIEEMCNQVAEQLKAIKTI